MLEQETASIIKFALDSAGNPHPYYYKVPENFQLPAAYFPAPDITSDGETFLTYALEFTWFIKFFHKTTQEAYDLALPVLQAIRRARNLIPLIDGEGAETGDGLRIKDPSLNTVDDGAVQLKLVWESRRPYDDPEPEKMMSYHIEGWSNPDIYLERLIPAAIAAQAEGYYADYPKQPLTGDYPPNNQTGGL